MKRKGLKELKKLEKMNIGKFFGAFE